MHSEKKEGLPKGALFRLSSSFNTVATSIITNSWTFYPIMVLLAIIAIALGLGISSVTAQEDDAVNIKYLDYAAYAGYNQANGVSFWKGMRYAASPTGSLRFAEPQDPEVQTGVQNATSVDTYINLPYVVIGYGYVKGPC